MEITDLSPAKWLSALADEATELVGLRSHLRSIRRAYSHASRVMPNHLLVFLQQGKLKAKVDGSTFFLKPGDILWIPVGVRRRFFWQEAALPNVDYRIHFTLQRNERHLSFCRTAERRSEAWHLLPMFQIMTQASNVPIEHNDHYMRGTLLGLCAGYLSLEQANTTDSGAFNALQRQRLDEFISRHIGDAITPRDLSVELSMSHDYFTRIFKSTYGLAPRYYLKQQRIRLAASLLLESDISIAEAGRQVGFADANLFSRQFREILNCSPREFRRANANTQFGTPE